MLYAVRSTTWSAAKAGRLAASNQAIDVYITREDLGMIVALAVLTGLSLLCCLPVEISFTKDYSL